MKRASSAIRFSIGTWGFTEGGRFARVGSLSKSRLLASQSTRRPMTPPENLRENSDNGETVKATGKPAVS
jgi:hypothetical protein